MAPALAPPFEDLTFGSPLSDEHATRLVEFLAPDLTGTVVDVGCGWAELLLRVIDATPGARGLGIDLDEEAIVHARGQAAARGLDHRVELRHGDAGALIPDEAAAAICIGASQVWGPPVDANEPLDYVAALRALRALLVPGGRLVYGECVWSQPPTDAAIAPLAGRADEFVTLAELIELAADEGFQPVTVFEATLDEWDAFESGNAACYARWLADHPADHPDAERVREFADHQRTAYYDGYRGILGMAYLGLVVAP